MFFEIAVLKSFAIFTRIRLCWSLFLCFPVNISYDSHVVIVDFNLDSSTGLLKHFMNSNALYNLIKVNTCFKGKEACIDLILTNWKYSFKNINTIETGLSDHHHMIYAMLKSTIEKAEPIKLIYRDYKNFLFDRFKADLENVLKS